jgi:predicted lipoprotein with Yx(FWY)xxD motif
MKRAAFRLAVVAGLAALLCSLAVPVAGANTATHTVISSSFVDQNLGTILTLKNDDVLYAFSRDRSDRSACSRACRREWRPVLSRRSPIAARGSRIQASLLGEIHLSNGRNQVVYNGHPLYTRIGEAPNQVSGEPTEYGGHWFILNTRGRPDQMTCPDTCIGY